MEVNLNTEETLILRECAADKWKGLNWVLNNRNPKFRDKLEDKCTVLGDIFNKLNDSLDQKDQKNLETVVSEIEARKSKFRKNRR